jgi:Tol biopolymer transport system component
MRIHRCVALLSLLALASGCGTTPPILLHQRGSTIWVMADDGTKAKSVVAGRLPRWNWTGWTHFAYWVQAPPVAGQTVGTVHVAEWDGGKQAVVNATAITDATAGEHFAWSRDGLWIVFESHRDGNWEIYKVRRDGTQLQNLTNSPSSADREPAWARPGPTNGKIAFVSNRTGNRDLFVMDENGSGLVNFTGWIPGLDNKPDGGDDFAPTWASDGDRIAFVGTHEAWANFTPQIYLTSVSQPGSLLVVSDASAGAYDHPRWVDANTVVFFGGGPGGGLWRYDMKGATNTRTLLSGGAGLVGWQYSSDPAEVYVGTSQGIEAYWWNVPGQQRLVGPGLNPCRDGDCH